MPAAPKALIDDPREAAFADAVELDVDEEAVPVDEPDALVVAEPEALAPAVVEAPAAVLAAAEVAPEEPATVDPVPDVKQLANDVSCLNER